MQTALRDTLLTGTKGIVSAMVMLCSMAQACDGPQNLPGQYIDLEFGANASEISGSEVVRLAEWAIDMRARFPIRELVWIVGLANSAENNARRLSEVRADNVKSMLQRLNLSAERTDAIGRVYSDPLNKSPSAEEGRRVEVTLSPGCANHCCGGGGTT